MDEPPESSETYLTISKIDEWEEQLNELEKKTGVTQRKKSAKSYFEVLG